MKAVIMAGGQGTRFWPVSRENSPKQFLTLSGGGQSLIQETVGRLTRFLRPEDIFVICSRQYVAQVLAQFPEMSRNQIIEEPVPRSTAPCVGLAACYLRRRFPEEVVAMLPSDHVIKDVAEFELVLKAGAQLAAGEWLVTFGIEPSYPATGYGYLRRGARVGEYSGRSAYRVARFTEKPNLAKAKGLLRRGDHYWNSGMFVWTIKGILAQIEACMPELHSALEEIDQCGQEAEKVRQIFSGLESISIDFGVMEKAKKVAMLPCQLGWSDVGNWKALAEIWPQDEQGLVSNGRHLAIDSRDSILFTSDGKMVALVGVENIVVVETPDALLVCDRTRTEEVRHVVERLKAKGWTDYL